MDLVIPISAIGTRPMDQVGIDIESPPYSSPNLRVCPPASFRGARVLWWEKPEENNEKRRCGLVATGYTRAMVLKRETTEDTAD